MKKTNAMRILDSKKISYDEIEYDTSKGISGVDVAISTGENPANVYKTLVTYSKDKEYFVFVVPVGCELDLKKGCKCSENKKDRYVTTKRTIKSYRICTWRLFTYRNEKAI